MLTEEKIIRQKEVKAKEGTVYEIVFIHLSTLQIMQMFAVSSM